MTRDEAICELKCAIELIKQNGKDWIDEQDIPLFNMAIEALGQYENAFEHGYTEAESKYREILERKRGEWIKHESPRYVNSLECPLCHCWFIHEHLVRNSFCPNCGADMRGK